MGFSSVPEKKGVAGEGVCKVMKTKAGLYVGRSECPKGPESSLSLNFSGNGST